MLFGFLVVLFVLVCLALSLLILIQSDKGGGISGALGGGLSSASSVLGTRDTANILTRGTAIFSAAYMVLCIAISLVVSRGVGQRTQESVLQERAEEQKSYSPSSVLEGRSLPVAPSESAQAPNQGEQQGGQSLPLQPGAPSEGTEQDAGE